MESAYIFICLGIFNPNFVLKFWGIAVIFLAHNKNSHLRGDLRKLLHEKGEDVEIWLAITSL